MLPIGRYPVVPQIGRHLMVYQLKGIWWCWPLVGPHGGVRWREPWHGSCARSEAWHCRVPGCPRCAANWRVAALCSLGTVPGVLTSSSVWCYVKRQCRKEHQRPGSTLPHDLTMEAKSQPATRWVRKCCCTVVKPGCHKHKAKKGHGIYSSLARRGPGGCTRSLSTAPIQTRPKASLVLQHASRTQPVGCARRPCPAAR